MKQPTASLRTCAAAMAVLSLAAGSALADRTWNGTADNQWTTTGNWSGNAIPGSGDSVIFNANSTGNLSNWLSQAFTIKGILFTNPAGPVSINSASTLTCNGGGINLTNAAQPLTITAPLAVGANQNWLVVTNQVLTVSGGVSGSSGFGKDGWGALILSGANAFTGSFTNIGGAVWINNSAGLGTGAKSITVANNSTGAGLHLNGTNGNISLPSNQGFVLSQQYGGIFNEAGDNAINGAINVFSGGGYGYILANGGSLTLNGAITLGTTPRAISLGGAAGGTNNGGISGAGFPFRKVDAGTWTFTGNNPYTGYTTVEGGTLALGPNAKLGGTTNLTVFANAILDLSAVTNAAGSNALFLAANQILAGGGAIVGSINAGPAIQPGGLNQAQIAGGMGAAGTLSLSSNLVMAATTTNYFELNTANTVGSGVNDLVNVGGNLDPESARIYVTALSPLTPGVPYRLFNYAGSKASFFNSTVLTNPLMHYTYTLDESVPNQVNVTASALPNLTWKGGVASSTWDLNSTANWNNNASPFLTFDPVVFDDSATTNTVTLSGTLAPSSVTFNNSAAGYLLQGSGKITGLAGVTLNGAGLVVVTTTGSDYTGPVTVNGGTLSVNSVALNGSASSLGAGTNISLNGGTFRFGGAKPAQGGFNRYWTLGPNGGTILSTNGVFFIPNTISGPGSLTKTGTVQIILGDILTGALTNANNGYAGNTYVAQGELQIRNAHGLGYGKAVVSSNADLAVGGGANYGTVTNEIDLNGGDGNNGSGTLQVNDGGTTVVFGGIVDLLADSSVGTINNGNAVSFTIAGPVIGTGGLKKLGTNTVTLTSPDNSYTGNTVVSAGRLALSGSASLAASPSVSIAGGAILDASGLTSGITFGGTSPQQSLGGASPSGTAQVNAGTGAKAVTLAAGAGAVFQAAGGAVSSLGKISVAGDVNLNGNTITVNVTGSPLAAGTYRLLDCTGTLSGAAAGTPGITGTALAAGYTAAVSTVAGAAGHADLIVSATPAFTGLAAGAAISYGTTSIVLTGTLSSPAGPTPIYPAPGDTVTVTINGQTVSGAVNNSTGSFSVTYNDPSLASDGAAGSPYPITYAYAGNGTQYLNAAGDASTALTVNKAPSTVTLTGTTAFTYNGSPQTPAFAVAGSTGALTDSYSGTGATVYGPSASAPAAAGTYSVTATVSADANYNGASSAPAAFTINPAAPALALSASANPSGYGDRLTFTAALPADATGSVVFQANGAAFSTNALVNGGADSASVTNLARGTNLVSALYAGDANYAGETNSLSQVVTNHPPTAALLAISLPAGINSFKIALSDLATNWSDADGDTISLVSVAASTNGAAVSTNGGYALYYNPSPVNDQFSYTIADSYGDTNIGQVNIVIDTAPLFGQASPAIDTTGGAPALTFAGIPGYRYSLARSTDLGTWTVIWTTNAPPAGVFQYTDADAPLPTAFYRLEYNP